LQEEEDNFPVQGKRNTIHHSMGESRSHDRARESTGKFREKGRNGHTSTFVYLGFSNINPLEEKGRGRNAKS